MLSQVAFLVTRNQINIWELFSDDVLSSSQIFPRTFSIVQAGT